MKFTVVTLFPEFFKSPLATSILGRAIESGRVQVEFINPRDFALNKHHTVDDRPFGGARGMVLLPDVAERVFQHIVTVRGAHSFDAFKQSVSQSRSSQAFQGAGLPPFEQLNSMPLVVAMSPQATKQNQLSSQLARSLAGFSEIVFWCGHYEGIDERAIEQFSHLDISVGDYVLTGGETAALAALEAIVRFVPDVVGQQASVDNDSFEPLLKGPVYTRPQVFAGESVPEVLTSGDHKKINVFENFNRLKRTFERRPDLFQERVHDMASIDALAALPENPFYVALLHHPMVDRHGKTVTTAVTNLDIHDIARSCRTYGVEKYFIVNPEEEQRRIVQAILGHWHEEISKVYHPARAEALRLVEFQSTFEEVYNDISRRHGCKPFVLMPDARDLSAYFSESRRHRFTHPKAQSLSLVPDSAWPAWSYEKLRIAMQSKILMVADEKIPVMKCIDGVEKTINETVQVASHPFATAKNKKMLPLLLVLGTGYGLSDTFFDSVDLVLEPILREPRSKKSTEATVAEPSEHSSLTEYRLGDDYNHLSVRSALAIILDRLFGQSSI